jgi:cytochrome c553
MSIRSILTTVLTAIALVPLAATAAPEDGKAKAAPCGACHGEDGNSATGDFPILAGQTARYLYLQLKDYKEGRRKNPIMQPMAANLSKQDMWDLANYFAAQKQKPNGFKADAEKVVRGKKVADDALCPMCHLGGFSGQNEVPRVAGQHQAYIQRQLLAFKTKERTNYPDMNSYIRSIPEEDIEALSHYIANLN